MNLEPVMKKQHRRTRGLIIALLSCVLAACNTLPSQSQTAAEIALQESLERAQENPSAQSADDSEAALPAPLPAAVQDRFDIAVNEVPARAFFLGLVKGTDTNMVVHPEVDGSISLELKNVSVEEVLSVTRDVFGYEYSISRDIYTIYPRKLRSEVFAINYLDVQRRGLSDTSVLVGEISSNNNRNNNYNNRNTSGGFDNEVSGSNQSERSTGSRIQTTSDSNFWQTLEHSLQAIVGGEGEDRMVMVNSQTGIAVIRALPTELAAVRRFLEKSQLSAVRQVILETKIVEVRLDDAFEAGINWSAIQGQLNSQYMADMFKASGTSPRIDRSGTFSAALGISNISDLLQLLETQGHVQVLSSPRVATVNNQKAIIRVGSDEFFVTGISNQTTASAAITTTTPTVELASFFSGIALDVTPQIADNGDVILHVHPVVSEVRDQVKQLTVGDEEFSLPLALREIRESDSIVRARNGQVIVLGGLMQENTSEQKGSRPWLAEVPVLNLFFKTRNDRTRKTELVILMRPIVVDDEAWDRDIRQSEQRIRALGADYRQQF